MEQIGDNFLSKSSWSNRHVCKYFADLFRSFWKSKSKTIIKGNYLNAFFAFSFYPLNFVDVSRSKWTCKMAFITWPKTTAVRRRCKWMRRECEWLLSTRIQTTLSHFKKSKLCVLSTKFNWMNGILFVDEINLIESKFVWQLKLGIIVKF